MARTLLGPGMLSCRKLLVACLMLSAVGCFEDEPLPSGAVTGELGQAAFAYVCDGSAVVGCEKGTASTFPLAVAVGAPFKIARPAPATTFGLGPAYGAVALPIAEARVVRTPFGEYIAPREGTIGFMFDSGLDYLNISARQPQLLQFRRVASQGTAASRIEGPLTLAPSGSLDLAVIPVDAEGTPLAGDIRYAIVSSNPSVVGVETTGRPFAKLRASGPGSARVRAEGAGVQSELEIVVQ